MKISYVTLAIFLGFIFIGFSAQAADEIYTAQRSSANSSLIDYEHSNLLKSDRVVGTADTFAQKTVFCANISSELNKNINDPDFFPKDDFWKNLDRVKYEIFLSDKDGLNPIKLTESEKGTLCASPSFTADGKRVTFLKFSKAKQGDDYTLTMKDEQPLVSYNTNKYPIASKTALRNDLTKISGYLLTEGFIVNLETKQIKQLTLAEFDKLRIERNIQTGKGPQR